MLAGYMLAQQVQREHVAADVAHDEPVIGSDRPCSGPNRIGEYPLSKFGRHAILADAVPFGSYQPVGDVPSVLDDG